MFRLMKTLCAEKATANLYATKLPNTHSIEVQQTISRIIAATVVKFGTARHFEHVLTAKDASPTAMTAARLGRAFDLLSRDMQKPALVDIDAVLASTAGTEHGDFTFLANALRLKAHNKMLDNAEGKMMVSGSANEMEVSELRSVVRADIATLTKERPHCWLVALAKAEFALAEGHCEQAIAGFDHIIKTINKMIRDSSKPFIVDGEVIHPACTVAYQLQVGRKPSKETLDAARKVIGVPSSVADEYLYGICEVVNAAFTSHHMVEYFSAHEGYNLWVKSPEMEVTANRILRAAGMGDAGVTVTALEALKLEKPVDAFHGAEGEQKLSKLLASSDPIVPSDLLRRFGTPGKITTSDDTYDHLMKSIESNVKSSPSAGARCISDDESLIQSLRLQMLYRAEVSKAVALEGLERVPEALEVLNGVIAANKYLYMWKAFAARGRMLRAFGKFEEADNDFKALFALKKMQSGYDVPQSDVNRTVSAF